MSRQLQPCGTPAAYQRHRRREEEPCDPCKAAHQQETNEHRNRAGYNRARSRALNRLARMHPTEFRRLYTEELAVEALREQP